MKRILNFGLLIAAVLLMTVPAEAQTTLNPSNVKLFNTYSITNSTSYTASLKDTSDPITVAGAGLVSLTLTVRDTAAVDYFVDKRIRNAIGDTSWTNILTDSLINDGASSNSGKRQEYVLRVPGTEKFAGIDVAIRTRKAFRASGQGTSSATFSEKLNFKP